MTLMMHLTFNGLKDGNYEIRVESGTSLFDQKNLNLIASLIKTAARNMMSLPYSKIKEISLIPVDDKEMPLKLLELGSGKKLEIKDDDNIISAFKQKAMESPEDTAVHFRDNSYTYAQIDKISDIIADTLINKANVKKGDIVGVFTSRCEKMVSYPLGIMKAGAAYLPLDENLPQKRLEIICNDARLKAIVTEENTDLDKFKSLSDLIFKESGFNLDNVDNDNNNNNNNTNSKEFTSFNKEPTSFDKEPTSFDKEPTSFNKDLDYYKKEIRHEDPAVILYTSGSTGKPKE